MKLIYYLLLLIPQIVLCQGSALLVGGGSENYNRWSDEPYGWFVQQADSGKIINIDVSTASSWYPNYFKWLGADQSSHELQISNQTIANDSATYSELISAKGIFIEGGDQWDYVSTWKGTLVEDAIHYVFNSGGAIGGTSAGLAILGEVVFDAKYGSAYPDVVAYNPYNSRINFTDDFLEILPNILTDSHLHSRGRLGRLIPMMARRIQDFEENNIIGIGITDNTALCIDENKMAKTYGDAAVTILYVSDNSYISCQPNKPLTFTNINFDQLIPGAVYDLNTKTLIDPGPYLAMIGTPSFNPVFSDTSLDGSNESTINLGNYTITNLTSSELIAWYGNLIQGAGLGLIPNSVIIPKIYNDNTFDENRWVGGMWICTIHPHSTVIYLDNNCTANINTAGMLTSNKLTYILDTYSATYAGVNGTRSTNYCGIIGGKLHFLGTGDKYDLLNHTPVLTHIEDGIQKPLNLDLKQNYPNPFNDETVIKYSIPHTSEVSLIIYNLLGKQVENLVTQQQKPGEYSINWDAGELASGIYFYELKTEHLRKVKKCLLIR
ncbi:T9SS type A sorting domain-containing protein [Calditrichota bacterium]